RPSVLHPRNLHYFPTRRSSDLKKCGKIKWSIIILHFPIYSIWTGSKEDESIWNLRCVLGSQKNYIKSLHCALPRMIHIRQHLVLDRKRTRLNSSHVSISYAVFC